MKKGKILPRCGHHRGASMETERVSTAQAKPSEQVCILVYASCCNVVLAHNTLSCLHHCTTRGLHSVLITEQDRLLACNNYYCTFLTYVLRGKSIVLELWVVVGVLGQQAVYQALYLYVLRLCQGSIDWKKGQIACGIRMLRLCGCQVGCYPTFNPALLTS